jgi:hypothetical protein
MPSREEYTTPVGFAREPAQQRRHWFGRLVLAAFIVLLGYLLLNGVLRAPDETSPPPSTGESLLPGPL